MQAEVASVSTRPMRNRPGTIFEAVVTDGRGRLTLTFFGRGRQDWREKMLQPGVRGLFAGQVSSFQGKRQLAHPDYELLGTGESGARAAEFAAELIPIYPASKDSPPGRSPTRCGSRSTCSTPRTTRCPRPCGTARADRPTPTRCAGSTARPTGPTPGGPRPG